MDLGEIFTAPAIHDDLAARGGVQTAANVEQSGLTAAAFTEQEHHTRFGKPNGNVIQSLYVRAAFGFVDF